MDDKRFGFESSLRLDESDELFVSNESVPVSATDPATFTGVAVCLVGVAWVAWYLPRYAPPIIR